ncbi:MAG: hypothetical protein CMN60_21450 [Sphingobium sp.]|nr:hypothetical protein [Sphingobium sp.]MBS50199.1 hypothetical protein [Sphingobium sp.]|tara:strand:+ start:15436 stop:15690 length:255 start_codon:yes stop_codon:yes gene_type:complete
MSGITSNKTAMLIIRPVSFILALIGILLLVIGFFATLTGISTYADLHGVHRMNILPVIMIGALALTMALALMLSGWTRIFSNRK